MDRPQVFPAEGERRMRVALLAGCAQQVLMPQINEATIRLLTRHGCEVVTAEGSGCCGSLAHHLGQEEAALAFARANIDAWERERASGGLDAIVVNASGCGTTLKDYGFMLREDPAYAEKAARIAALARDVTEVVETLGLPAAEAAYTGRRRVAYHSACSMQHGQRIHGGPEGAARGRRVRAARRARGPSLLRLGGHLQSAAAGDRARLRDRKLANIARTRPELVATGNIGCITQLAARSPVPVVHTVELLDWATGGPMPIALTAASATGGGRSPGSAARAPSAAPPIRLGSSQLGAAAASAARRPRRDRHRRSSSAAGRAEIPNA